jgi:hypothetical protein
LIYAKSVFPKQPNIGTVFLPTIDTCKTKSAFGVKVATHGTSQKKEIGENVAICGGVTIQCNFLSQKRVWQSAAAPPKNETALDLFLFSLPYSFA